MALEKHDETNCSETHKRRIVMVDGDETDAALALPAKRARHDEDDDDSVTSSDMEELLVEPAQQWYTKLECQAWAERMVNSEPCCAMQCKRRMGVDALVYFRAGCTKEVDDSGSARHGGELDIHIDTKALRPEEFGCKDGGGDCMCRATLFKFRFCGTGRICRAAYCALMDVDPACDDEVARSVYNLQHEYHQSGAMCRLCGVIRPADHADPGDELHDATMSLVLRDAPCCPNRCCWRPGVAAVQAFLRDLSRHTDAARAVSLRFILASSADDGRTFSLWRMGRVCRVALTLLLGCDEAKLAALERCVRAHGTAPCYNTQCTNGQERQNGEDAVRCDELAKTHFESVRRRVGNALKLKHNIISLEVVHALCEHAFYISKCNPKLRFNQMMGLLVGTLVHDLKLLCPKGRGAAGITLRATPEALDITGTEDGNPLRERNLHRINDSMSARLDRHALRVDNPPGGLLPSLHIILPSSLLVRCTNCDEPFNTYSRCEKRLNKKQDCHFFYYSVRKRCKSVNCNKNRK